MPKKELNYEEYVEKLNRSPLFESIAKNFDCKRIGLQILRDEEIVKEITSHNEKGQITRIEEGLNEPEFTARIDEKTLLEMISPKEQSWIEKNPLQAALKYSGKVELPFIVKLKLLKALKGYL